MKINLITFKQAKDEYIDIERLHGILKTLHETAMRDDKIKMMGETLQKLRKELSLKDKKIKELEGINKELENIKVNQGAVYLKGSNITQRM